MVELTTLDGTFRGETEKDVLKASRKARRAALAVERLDSMNRYLAHTDAERAGYKVLAMLARIAVGERDHAPQGWHIKRPGEQYGPRVRSRNSGTGHIAIYDTPDGRAEYDHNGYYVLATLEDGAGFDIAVWLQDVDVPDRISAYGVGVHGECAALADLPGARIEQFEKVMP